MMTFWLALETRLAAIDKTNELPAAVQAVTDAISRRNAAEAQLAETKRFSGLFPEQHERFKAELAVAEEAVTEAEATRDAIRAKLKAKLDKVSIPARLRAARQIVAAHEQMAKAKAVLVVTQHAYRQRQLEEPLKRLSGMSKADAQAALDEHQNRKLA